MLKISQDVLWIYMKNKSEKKMLVLKISRTKFNIELQKK